MTQFGAETPKVKTLGVIFPSQENKLGNSQVTSKRLAERRKYMQSQSICVWHSPSIRH